MTSDFASLSLSSGLIAVLAELGYSQPTPIQVASIPPLVGGKDLIGQSKTGSGKTMAFALPILQRLDMAERVLQALVVCPTRELAAQVVREFRKLGRRHSGLQVLTVAGGEPARPQANALQLGVHIAVGTPGRLLDHLRRRTMAPHAITTVVLDEADRMLDMGFQADVESILELLPAKRQTAFFSATFPSSIASMSQSHQKDAVRVTLDDAQEVIPEIRQLSLEVEPDRKLHALYWLLSTYPHESALIFCNFKASAAELVGSLSSDGISVDCLSGDLEQFRRDQVLAMFRNGSLRVLVATDVAARGIDVEDLDLVVNYELPQQTDMYLHRIGRTGRAGRVGLSITLTTARQQARLRTLEERTEATIERLPRLRSSESDLSNLAQALIRDPRMDTVLISGGRKDKIRPGDIVGALTGDAGGLSATDVGKIEIHDRLTYVAISRSVSKSAIKSLNAGRIKAKRFRASLVKPEAP